MVAKAKTESEVAAVDKIGAQVQAVGEAVVSLVDTLRTRDERAGHLLAASRVTTEPDALVASMRDLIGEGIPTMGDLVTWGDVEQAARLVSWVAACASEKGVGVDLAALVDEVRKACEPLAGMVASADLLGIEIPETVTTILGNAEAAIAQAGAATTKSPKVPGSKVPRGSAPWSDAGPLVRMTVTAPDGTVYSQKASNPASVYSSTKSRFGATLPMLAGENLGEKYLAAWNGEQVKIPTSLGEFLLVRQG